MKKFTFIPITLVLMIILSGFSVTRKTQGRIYASEVIMSLGITATKISLADYSKLSLKDYQQLTAKHLNFFQRLEFSISQNKLRNHISADGTVEKKVAKSYFSDGDHSTGFHLGGFLLGMTIIGILVAYMLPAPDDETKKNRVKWAWRGALFALSIGIVILKVAVGN